MTTAASVASVESAACEKRKKIIIKRKPGQQQLSKEADNVSIRLLDFNIYDANAIESAENDSNEDVKKAASEAIAKIKSKTTTKKKS